MLHQDIRYGFRQLRKSPGFALVAVLTLALGIGANTAMFSVVDTILLRPLPYQEPDRLMLVSETETVAPGDELGVAAQEYLDYRDQNHSFSSVAAFESDGFNLTGRGPTAADSCRSHIRIRFSDAGCFAAHGPRFQQRRRPLRLRQCRRAVVFALAKPVSRRSEHSRAHHQARREAVHRYRRDASVVPFSLRRQTALRGRRPVAADRLLILECWLRRIA